MPNLYTHSHTHGFGTFDPLILTQQAILDFFRCFFDLSFLFFSWNRNAMETICKSWIVFDRCRLNILEKEHKLIKSRADRLMVNFAYEFRCFFFHCRCCWTSATICFASMYLFFSLFRYGYCTYCFGKNKRGTKSMWHLINFLVDLWPKREVICSTSMCVCELFFFFLFLSCRFFEICMCTRCTVEFSISCFFFMIISAHLLTQALEIHSFISACNNNHIQCPFFFFLSISILPCIQNIMTSHLFRSFWKTNHS